MSQNNANSGTHLVEEEESYFVSMTDMMVGMIFIFVILLMTFALNFRAAQEKNEDVEARRQQKIDQLEKVQEARTAMLVDIENALKEKGIRVVIDIENGILHLPEEVLFSSGSATLNTRGINSLGHLARALYSAIPCYTYLTEQELIEHQCDIAAIAKLDAIFVEGHTDNVRVNPDKSKFADNWELSAQRAITTFKALMQIEPNLDKLTHIPIPELPRDGIEGVEQTDNAQAGRLFSVAGYGEYRPRSSNLSPDGRKNNRRIDLRFLMKTPRPKDMDIVEEKIISEADANGS